VIHSMWYTVPRLSVGGPECDGTDCVFGVKDVARVEQHPSHRIAGNMLRCFKDQ